MVQGHSLLSLVHIRVVSADNRYFRRVRILNSPMRNVQPSLGACLAATAMWAHLGTAVAQVPVAFTAPHIKSVRLHPPGAPLGGPFMELNGEAGLVLRYDDLSGDWPDHEWTLVHCLSDWSAFSDLTDWDFLEGWAPDDLEQVDNSFGGDIPFAHVSSPIPSRDLRPTRSGHYLLVVHEAGDPDAVVLLRRMVVYERLTNLELGLRRPLEADKVQTHQRLEAEVELLPGHRWFNPMQDVRISVMQNGAWPTAAHNIPADQLRGEFLTYSLDPGLTFDGGDRWRSADLKSLAYLAPGIERMTEPDARTGQGWQFLLGRDASRRFKLQTSRPDLKGAFTVHNDRFDDVELTSEYLDVTFRLEHPNFGNVPEVYVFGALSGWTLDPAFRMAYDAEKLEYRLTTRLKQGWVDYQYVAPSSGTSALEFEGHHSGTPNRYQVWVHAPAPDGEDRIIGFDALDFN